jgi:hypothetical protein
MIVRERKTSVQSKTAHPNRYTSPAYALKKRLDVLWARIGRASTSSHDSAPSFRYVNNTDAWTLIVAEYDRILTDVYNVIMYIITLDRYTSTVTHNRGYYCRKKKQLYWNLKSEYTANPKQLYPFRDVARDRFFTNTNSIPSTKWRIPLNNYLFNYLMKLQDEQKNK